MLGYLHFLVPLMALTITPPCRACARRGGRFPTSSASPAGSTGATSAARALASSSIPLVTLQIADALRSNVLVGSEAQGK